jgi:hypothetical protein
MNKRFQGTQFHSKEQLNTNQQDSLQISGKNFPQPASTCKWNVQFKKSSSDNFKPGHNDPNSKGTCTPKCKKGWKLDFPTHSRDKLLSQGVQHQTI